MQKAFSLGQQVQPSVLSSAERIVKNLKVWLDSQSSLGTSVMEEATTRRQMVGAALIVLALVLMCLCSVSFFFAPLAALVLLPGSRMIQDEKGGAS